MECAQAKICVEGMLWHCYTDVSEKGIVLSYFTNYTYSLDENKAFPVLVLET